MACWIYEHYGLRILPWDSVWTWIIAFLVVDLSFYWFHRASHGIYSVCYLNSGVNWFTVFVNRN